MVENGLWDERNKVIEQERKEERALVEQLTSLATKKQEEYVEKYRDCQIMMGQLQAERLEVVSDKVKLEKKSDKEWARVAKCLEGVRELERKRRELLEQIQRRRAHGKGADSDEACKSGS